MLLYVFISDSFLWLYNSNSIIKELETDKIGKAIFYEMPEIRSIDIDSKLDFELVEFLLKKRKAV